MFSCMPIVSPILLANGATREASLRALLPLTLGRISGYVSLLLSPIPDRFFIKSLIRDTELMGYLLGSITLFMALPPGSMPDALHRAVSPLHQRPKAPSHSIYERGVALDVDLRFRWLP